MFERVLHYLSVCADRIVGGVRVRPGAVVEGATVRGGVFAADRDGAVLDATGVCGV